MSTDQWKSLRVIADILADDASRYTPDSLAALRRLLAGYHLEDDRQ